MLEVGKLYTCEDCYLMLYPDKDAVSTAEGIPSFHSSAGGVQDAYPVGACCADADFWSNRLGKPVSYREKNIPLLVLKAEEKFYEVLIEDKKGWIIYEDFLNIKEIE